MIGSEAEERAALRRDGYKSAIDDALEVVATADSRLEIVTELRNLRAEVMAP